MFDTAALVKYVLEGLAVIVAAFILPRRGLDLQELLLLGLTAAATLALLDSFAPTVGQGARLGAGFKVGMNLVGAGRTN